MSWLEIRASGVKKWICDYCGTVYVADDKAPLSADGLNLHVLAARSFFGLKRPREIETHVCSEDCYNACVVAIVEDGLLH